MFEGKRILAIVPARGGSKGLPGKNIRPLQGRPLIAWSIEAGLQSRYVDELIVSTDCHAIAEAARTAGAGVPFIRPADLATDSARSIDATIHAVEQLEEMGATFDLIMLLQPTSPLRSSQDIDEAVELFFSRQAQSVVSVCENDHHPWWSNTLPSDGNMADFLRPEALNANRQTLPPYYRLNGAIYLTEIGNLKKNDSFFGPRTFAFVMPRDRSVDIDGILDFHLAEAILAYQGAPESAVGKTSWPL